MIKAIRQYIDTSYLAEKRKNPRVRFQVYGTVIMRKNSRDGTLIMRKYSHVCFIYHDKDNIYYNAVGSTQIISPNIKKLHVHHSIFSKKIIRIKIKADKTHKLTIFKYDSFSTNITGSQPQHCQELIDALEKMCMASDGKIKNKIKNT